MEESFLIQVEENEYPLPFDPEAWSDFRFANCYVYALGIHADESMLIGDFIGKRITCHASQKEQEEVLLEELNELGFDAYESEPCDYVEEGNFMIYIEWDQYNRYHFYRRDLDGTWSHKAAGELPTQLFHYGFPVVNPEVIVDSEGTYGKCFTLTKLY